MLKIILDLLQTQIHVSKVFWLFQQEEICVHFDVQAGIHYDYLCGELVHQGLFLLQQFSEAGYLLLVPGIQLLLAL